jgi:hypothetical protein
VEKDIRRKGAVMAKRKSKKSSPMSMAPSTERKSVEIQKASNGYVVNMSKTSKNGKWSEKKFVAKSKSEANQLASKLL